MKKHMLLCLGIIVAISVLLAPQSAHAGVNDFTFKDFKGDYYLSRDDQGRSVLKVVETFTAEFPDFDQNKGVARAIPGSYDGHSVSVKVQSLTRNGGVEPIYNQYRKNDHWVVETGDDNYVHGNQTYELTYVLRDVTKDFDTHQEFYWDTVGVGSMQPFGSVTGVVHLDDSVKDLFTGRTACYEGGQGARTVCQVDEDGSIITFSSRGKIGPYQNVTMVMEFKADSFMAYKMSVLEWLKTYGIAIISLVVSATGLILILIGRFSRRRNAKGRGVIVPQYLPPEGVSVLEASDIKGKRRASMAAQIIDLAVRHKIRIIEQQGAGKKPTYKLEVLSLDGLREDDSAILRVTTGLQSGATYTLSAHNYGVSALLMGVRETATKRMLSRGYRKASSRRRISDVGKWLTGLAAFVPFGLLFLFAFIDQPSGGELSAESLPLFFVPFITWPLFFASTAIVASGKDPLTERGVDLKDYLDGLEMYMKVAEADRLRILQSPQGAERAPIDVSDKTQVVRLYERLLPYAILFGIEKDWAKTLEVAYGEVNTAPDWYGGMGSFNAAAFSSSLVGFTGAAASSFSPITSTNSSSSGFSSSGGGGGGFSGGGGGGGSFGGR